MLKALKIMFLCRINCSLHFTPTVNSEAAGYFQQLVTVTRLSSLLLLAQVCNNLPGKLLPNFLGEYFDFLRTEACNPQSLVMLYL